MPNNDYLDKLIEKISNNDKEAMGEFYLVTKSSVYGFALSITKNKELAEDIMQDTYIRLLQNAKNYKSSNKPMAWILRITRNLSLTRLASKENKELSLEDEWLGGEEDFSDSSIDKILLNKLLDKLEEEERQILILKSLSGLKYREIAEILGIPLSTCLSKYHRSISKLKKTVKEEAN